MASVIDAFNDALGEENAIVKIVLYAIPVFLCAYLYIQKNMLLFNICCIPTLLILAALLSAGICNIRANKRIILILNPIKLFTIIISLLLGVIPIGTVLVIFGLSIITFVKIPFDFPHFPLIFKSIVGLFVGSIILTSYLSFSKNLNIKSAYDIKAIYSSSIDILICILFLIPQLAIINGILIGSVWYVLFCFHIPINNLPFIFYCSAIFILNISILSSYFAQISYELIKGKDDEYRDNYYIKGHDSVLYDNEQRKRSKF